MRHWKTSMMLFASLVLAMLLGMAGCGNSHGDRDDRDHNSARYERRDNDRHEVRPETERHEERAKDSDHDAR